MVSTVEEIAGYRAEFSALLAEWNSLEPATRRREWDRFTDALDCGDAGWTRFGLILEPAWCEGYDPTDGLSQDPEVGLVPARAAAPS